jgi:hypothetical protein
MNRLFRESYGPEGPEDALTTTSLAPLVDIYDDEHNITLKLDVPGKWGSRSDRSPILKRTTLIDANDVSFGLLVALLASLLLNNHSPASLSSTRWRS